jgi:hypothetical protein
MKKIFTFFTSILFVLLFINNSPAQETFVPSNHVVPPANASVAGGTSFLGPLANSARTYQMLIHESMLTAMVGLDIQSISYRLGAAAANPWPAADISYQDYRVYLSGSVPPAERSFVFAENIVGQQTMVRSGPLTIRTGIYTSGSSPNAWGDPIEFDTVWSYSGGHLLVEIRHSGFSGTSASVDALGTSTAGYGNMYSAIWQGTTTVLQGNFTIHKLVADDPVPVELASFNAIVSGNAVTLNWVTATETNNMGFDIERLSENSWQKIGFINGAGTTTETNNYAFTDQNLKTGHYLYRLKQIDFDGNFNYSYEIKAEVDAPVAYSLNQNYPNPFNPSTTISFALEKGGNVRIIIYNSIGEEVMLLNEEKEAGYHQQNINLNGFISGVYFYELRAGNFVQTKKMLLVK